MLLNTASISAQRKLHRMPDTLLKESGQLFFDDDDVEAAPLIPRPLFSAPIIDQWALCAHDRAILIGLRTLVVQQRGDALATAAEHMAGWFWWVNSGEQTATYYAKPQHVTKPYDLRHNRDKRDRDVFDPVQQHTIRRNTFLSWLLRGNKEPSISSNLNCWEAVLFSAYRAGLITRQTLATMHQPGPNLQGVTYRDRYMNCLGFNNSVPLNVAGGLLPARGDVMFWGQDEHVAICVDIDTTVATPIITLMNHWSPPAGERIIPFDPSKAHFHRIALDDLPRALNQHACRFTPCPF
jgi:hypothetical protein